MWYIVNPIRNQFITNFLKIIIFQHCFISQLKKEDCSKYYSSVIKILFFVKEPEKGSKKGEKMFLDTVKYRAFCTNTTILKNSAKTLIEKI